jgi:hypothetical protein
LSVTVELVCLVEKFTAFPSENKIILFWRLTSKPPAKTFEDKNKAIKITFKNIGFKQFI